MLEPLIGAERRGRGGVRCGELWALGVRGLLPGHSKYVFTTLHYFPTKLCAKQYNHPYSFPRGMAYLPSFVEIYLPLPYYRNVFQDSREAVGAVIDVY